MSRENKSMGKKGKTIVFLIVVVIIGSVSGVLFFKDRSEKYGDARDNMTAGQIEYYKRINEGYKRF